MTVKDIALQGLVNWIYFHKNSSFFKGREHEDLLKQLNKIAKNLEEKLTVLISGEFNAGKSTFINALLGEKILVSDITPATAMITKLTYGKEKKLLFHFKDQSVQECRFSFFKQVTAEGDECGAKVRESLNCIEIQLPHDFLKFYNIIDSPGVTSLFQKHSDVTEYFLKEADAAIWLFNSMNVGTAIEITWLKKLHDLGIPIFGLINGIDRLDEDEELDAFYEYNVRRLSPWINHLKGISSKDILEGKLKEDEILKDWGNLKVVESLFSGFEKEKMEMFFQQIQDPLINFKKIILKEKKESVYLDKRSQFLTLFKKIDSSALKISEELKAAYEKKNYLIAEWQLYLQNSQLEPTNIGSFISRFKNSKHLEMKWNSSVLPELNSFLKLCEDIQLHKKILNAKKSATEEHYNDIDKVYFKFLQIFKYIKSDEEYRSYAEATQYKVRLLNEKQKEIENLLKQFKKILKQEVKKEIWPINEKIKQLNINWNNQLSSLSQIVRNWKVDDFLNAEGYVKEIKDFQKKVLPFIYTAIENLEDKESFFTTKKIIEEIGDLYKEDNQTDLLDKIVQINSLVSTKEVFTVRIVNLNINKYSILKYEKFMPAPRNLMLKMYNLSPQMIKDPVFIAAGVVILMNIF